MDAFPADTTRDRSRPGDDASAKRYHRARLRLSLLGLGVGAIYLLGLTATGVAEALHEVIARLTPRWWLQLAILLGALALPYRLATLPLAWLGGFWLPRRYGLLHQGLAAWLWDLVKGMTVGAVLALAAAEIVYALLRATPWWWLWGSLALLAVSTLVTLVAPVWIVPLFYRLRPLEDEDLRRRLLDLADRARAPVLGAWVADQSRKSRTANAAVTGLGRTRRAILFDTLLGHFTREEIEVVLAHELAHHVHGDILRGLAFQAGLLLAAFWVADHALRAGERLLGLSGPGDLAGLPLLGLVLYGIGCLALPLANGWSRRLERQADDFALRLTGRTDAFVSAMERLAALNLADRDPHPVEEFIFYSHPSIGRRIARARGGQARGA